MIVRLFGANIKIRIILNYDIILPPYMMVHLLILTTKSVVICIDISDPTASYSFVSD